uniref:Armadillo repeat-containing domain-containing protein n=1 Tax=Ananas comosus var. bracteatus TaxID=296719 RepID=A0A6V7Q3R9_ANACO|nr:unnamed protein product [Ananas comosus var. bracteatus]
MAVLCDQREAPARVGGDSRGNTREIGLPLLRLAQGEISRLWRLFVVGILEAKLPAACLHSEASGHCFHSKTKVEGSPAALKHGAERSLEVGDAPAGGADGAAELRRRRHPAGGGGDGGGEEEEAALVRAIREVKNQIIGNKTKKLLYLELGAVPKIAAALVSPPPPPLSSSRPPPPSAASPAGSRTGPAPSSAPASSPPHPPPLSPGREGNHDVVDAAARSLKMIFQSTVAPKYDVLQEKNMNFLLSLLNSENENVTELAATIITHSCQRNIEQMALADAGVLQRLTSLLGGFLNQRDACLQSITAIVKNNSKVASKFVIMANGKAFNSLVELTKDRNHGQDCLPVYA